MAGEQDADAQVRLGGTPDRMKVGVTRYSPARGSGRPLSVQILREALSEAGVAAPLDEPAAAEVVRLLLAGQEARHLAIAHGVRPQNARDARFEPLCTPGLPVFPGQDFGRLHPPVSASEGRDIAGKAVPPDDAHSPKGFSVSGPIGQGADGMLAAQAAGVLRVEDARVALEPLVRIAPDKLAARVTLFATDAFGKEIAPEAMVLALSAQGVGFGIDVEAIVRGLAEAKASKATVDCVAARGQPAKAGADGRLELLVHDERSAVAKDAEDETSRVDYRERGEYPTVAKGQDVARLLPPGKGEPGRDVFGAVLPARDGRPLRLRAGKGVEAVENGALYRAKTGGIVLAGPSSLDVSELLSLPGDVDFSSGNIVLSQGSVRIAGTVRSGFLVQAPGLVQVGGMVESARVIAGHDVCVQGGIFMSGDEAAHVQAGGAVSAAYTHHAHVEAGGDVTVIQAIVGSKASKGSRVASGGLVRVTAAQGRIMGGTVVAARGIETFQAGSERGLPTTLALNHETPEITALVAEMRELKALMQRSVLVLGEGDGTAALARMPAERKDEARDLLGRRESAESRLRSIQRSLADLAQEHIERVASAKIIIRGTAFPGVAVKMGGKALYLDQAMEHCAFAWDPKAREIVTAAL